MIMDGRGLGQLWCAWLDEVIDLTSFPSVLICVHPGDKLPACYPRSHDAHITLGNTLTIKTVTARYKGLINK